MKTLMMKMALLAAVALAPLLSTQAAYAQRYHAAPQSSYDAEHSRPTDPRFTAEQQRIIDQITRNDWTAGQ